MCVCCFRSFGEAYNVSRFVQCTAHFISVELIHGTHILTHSYTYILVNVFLDSFTITFFGGFGVVVVAFVDSYQKFGYRYVALVRALAVIVIVTVNV